MIVYTDTVDEHILEWLLCILCNFNMFIPCPPCEVYLVQLIPCVYLVHYYSLDSNGLGPEGGKAIAAALAKNTTLTRIV